MDNHDINVDKKTLNELIERTYKGKQDEQNILESDFIAALAIVGSYQDRAPF